MILETIYLVLVTIMFGAIHKKMNEGPLFNVVVIFGTIVACWFYVECWIDLWRETR